MARLEAEIQKAANDSAKTQFDNISEEYGHKLDEIDKTSSFINNQITLTESINGFITASLYEKLVKAEEEHLNMLFKEKAALEENFKNVETGSSQWFEMRDIIWSVDEAIQSSNASIAENKQTLQSEKNLRDYEERTSKQTANIASIKKQIEALKGNTTEEARAKMQKLAVQLNEAEKDLEDTEYNKYISDQEEILDNLLEEFENFTSRQLSDMEGLIGKVINAMPSNSSIVNNTLNEIAGMWGIELSNALNASTLTGDYSTIADQSSATALIAQNIYDAVTGNYTGLSDSLLSVSSIM